MKIERNPSSPNLEPLGPNKTEATRQFSNTSGTPTTGAAGGDTVELSPEAQLASRISQEAATTPAIRQDMVDKAKQKLAAGEVGNDPMALAGSLIDQMLDE